MVQGDACLLDLTLTNISLSDYLWNNSVDDNTKTPVIDLWNTL